MNAEQGKCQICGVELQKIGELWLCPQCNDHQSLDIDSISESLSVFADEDRRLLIECPGATLYLPGTNEVTAGAQFLDAQDPTRGHKIINRPVYGPQHVRRRWIKKEDAHLIRRCQSCQDHTVRMKRKEGPDLYIPSLKNPQRPSHGQRSHYRNTNPR
ncbi:MAG: hypothetical protein GY841_13665 [FCB group bacterium]|nr:hypothetical protein [FCB group bacterium]